MKHIKPFVIFFPALLFLLNGYLFAQDVDIVPFLKQIEKGERKEVETKLPELKTISK